MFETFQPLYEKVLVKVDNQDQKQTNNGLYIPDTAQQKPTLGIIIAIGEGRITQSGSLMPLKVAIGDKVFFNQYHGVELEKGYLILREEEIMGIIKEQA